MTGTPRNPREGRQQGLVAFLRVALLIVVATALVAFAVPVERRELVSVATVIALIAVPMIRVGWLGMRWFQLGDHPYAWRAFALLAVMGAGAIVAT